MGLFSKCEFDGGTQKSLLTVSAKFARQRFLCTPEYAGGKCRGSCCRRRIVLLTAKDTELVGKYGELLSIGGGVLKMAGELCVFSDGGAMCGLATECRPFLCGVSPFLLSGSGKLVVNNSYMLRRCRVRVGKDGGEFAYRVFADALKLIFGERGVSTLTAHLDGGGGDISLPVSQEVLRILYWYREALNSFAKVGHRKTFDMLYKEVLDDF